jgi:hypothetical protein
MVVTYVGTYPYDPKLELKNFQQKQAEYEAAWRATSDPLVLLEAMLLARGYLKFPAELNWLMTALGEFITKTRVKGERKGRPSQTIEQYRDRMRHVRRYAIVRDLRQKGYKKEDALDLAVTALEAAGEATARRTIEDSYDLVSRDLTRAEHESEYFLLVARGDPTVVPVSVTQTPNGVAINGVITGGRDSDPLSHGGRDSDPLYPG